MDSRKITATNHSLGFSTKADSAVVRGKFYNQLKDDFDVINPSDGNLVADTVSLQTGIVQKTALTTLTATEIVGTAAGDVAHADGAILVAAPGTGYTLQFISAVLIYDHDTADYTGGGNDTVINVGVTGTQVAHTTAIAAAAMWTASADSITQVVELSASDQALVDNNVISLFAGTAPTQPGTAAGVLRCYVTYNVITHGL